MSKQRKTGNLSIEERKFIESYMGTKSDAWIAEQLNRTIHQVEKHRIEYNAKEAIKITNKEQPGYLYQLRARKYWGELQKQFTEEELVLFEDYWTRYLDQFSGDILYTEEGQLVDCIRYDILINRNLKDQADTIQQVDRFQKMVQEQLKLPVIDVERITKLEEQLLAARLASQARTNEHVKLQSEKNKLLSELKATRDKRITRNIDEKVNIFQLIKQLNDAKVRDKEARQGGLYNMAMRKEEERLSAPFMYDDNIVDLPILSADTIDRQNEQSEDSG